MCPGKVAVVFPKEEKKREKKKEKRKRRETDIWRMIK
jgi:hypothetical protein